MKKIISGGQSGADQAALQAAIDSGFDHGGWCPPGRICETGIIPEHFHLKETPREQDSSALDIPRSQRTILNVRDSDGSLIFWNKEVVYLQSDKGTNLALETAKLFGKPLLIVNPFEDDIVFKISKWIQENKIEILSVGGPSESNAPGIYRSTYLIMVKVLEF